VLRNCGRLAALSLTVLLGCSYFEKRTEVFFYNYSVDVLYENLDRAGAIEQCNFNWKIQPPDFFADTKLELKERAGYYIEDAREIHYLKYHPLIISHEVIHHLARHPYQTYYCLEQVSGSLLQRVVELELENKRLKSNIRNRK